MERPVGMLAAAHAKGEGYDTFRKRWRDYVLAGFPAPIEDRRPYKWRPSSLEAWQARREAETAAALLRAATVPDVPANDARPAAPPPRPRGLAAARDEIRALMRA